MKTVKFISSALITILLFGVLLWLTDLIIGYNPTINNQNIQDLAIVFLNILKFIMALSPFWSLAIALLIIKKYIYK